MTQGDKLIVTGILCALGFLLFFVRVIWPIWAEAGF